MEPYKYIEESSGVELCNKMNELRAKGYIMQGSIIQTTYTEHGSLPYTMLAVIMYLKQGAERYEQLSNTMAK